MKSSRFIAQRYLFSKGLPNIIHWFTLLSILSLCIGTAVFIVVLSVFNGFSQLLQEVFEKVDPDLKIVAQKSRWIQNPKELVKRLRSYSEVKGVSVVIEGKGVLQQGKRQYLVQVVGVDSTYLGFLRSRMPLLEGEWQLETQVAKATAVSGIGVAYYLNLYLNDFFNPSYLLSIDPKADPLKNPEMALRQLPIVITGIFQVQKQYDDTYIWVALPVAQYLFNTYDKASYIALWCEDCATLKKKLQRQWGGALQILDRNEQHETLFKVLKTEKWISYFIILLMVILISLNLWGNLNMIVIAKYRDLGILQAMGASYQHLKQVILYLTFYIGVLAVVPGTLLGILLVIAQKHWKLLKFSNAQYFIVDAFPVALEWHDVLIVLLTLGFVVWSATFYPSYLLRGRSIRELLHSK